MCGIVGYIGNKEASEILIDGLKRLEYRGYDSSGLAVISKNKIEIRRSVGKIFNLETILKKEPLSGTIGIAHTRWATHGKPSEENAHPHTDCKNKIVVVHNGIIENYPDLKKKLIDDGHKFNSETDTEVITHLIEKYYRGNLLEATERALSEIKGAYALGIISFDTPDVLIAARKECPLVIGVGEGENFLASDIPAILPYTKKVIFLDDGEIAEIKKDGFQVFDLSGNKIIKEPNIITWDPVMAEKSGYKHFMLKEIFEQPDAIQNTLRGRILFDEWDVYLDEINITADEILSYKKLFIVACGTAYHSGLVGKFLFENFAKIPTEVDIASEFRYRAPLIDKETLFLAISQSGETADTLAATKEAKSRGAKCISICNVVGSSLTRITDGILYTHCGPEIGVASTKAFTGQLTAIYLLMLYLGIRRNAIAKEEAKNIIERLVHIPTLTNKILSTQKEIEKLAKKFFKKTNFLYLGRNINYPIALEGALKLKEISYIHAEGYPAGEMKHGPIALIDENMPVVVIATKSKVYEKILSNIEEAKARGGIIIALATEGDVQIKEKSDFVYYLPEIPEEFSPILNTIPMQLLAYHIAVLRGCDVDQPRNLAKSVTVE